MVASRADFIALATLFRALADPGRLAIIGRLAQGEANVMELTRHLGLAQPTVSAHLIYLRHSGLVSVRRERNKSFYSLRLREVLDLLKCAEPMLECPYDPTTDTRARKSVRGEPPFQKTRGRTVRGGHGQPWPPHQQ